MLEQFIRRYFFALVTPQDRLHSVQCEVLLVGEGFLCFIDAMQTQV